MSIERAQHSIRPRQTERQFTDLHGENPRAWEQLFAEINPGLVRFGERLVRGHGEEIAQTAWLAFWRKARGSGLRPDTSPYSFLYTVVHNQIHEHYRQTRRLTTEPLETTEHVIYAIPMQGPSVEAQALQERPEDIFEQLGIKTPRDKQLFMLASMGYTTEEIAQILDTTPGALRVAKHRSRKNINTSRLEE